MPLTKDMSFGTIVKKEMESGKSQSQATAIAYKVTGKDNNLSWHDRMNTLDMRSARGTERYASKNTKDDTLDKPETRLENEADNIEGHGQIKKDGGVDGHVDEASEEEDEIQEDEVLKKKEMTPKGNSVTFRVVNDSKRQKILDAIQKLVIQRVDAGRQSDSERVKEIEEEIDMLESQL